jgi:hypothetical protein
MFISRNWANLKTTRPPDVCIYGSSSHWVLRTANRPQVTSHAFPYFEEIR